MVPKTKITTASQLWTLLKEGKEIFDAKRFGVYYCLIDNQIVEFSKEDDGAVGYTLNSFVFLCKFVFKKTSLYAFAPRK